MRVWRWWSRDDAVGSGGARADAAASSNGFYLGFQLIPHYT